eukprot:2309903-Ditylum_brightwellii.AAC.1
MMKYIMTQLTAGDVPIDVPVFWSHVVSPNVKTFYYMVGSYFQEGSICVNVSVHLLGINHDDPCMCWDVDAFEAQF